MTDAIKLSVPLAIAAVLASPGIAAAAQNVIHVPGDYPTIQQAIDAAADGDTVMVAAGTYNEAINFGDKSITITNAAITPAYTIIDAAGFDASAVTFDGAAQATLEGFAIRNGSGTSIPLLTEMIVGGGVLVASGSANIVNCVIETNTAQLGGGIYIGFDAAAMIDGSTVRSNDAGLGGGLFSNGGQPTVTNTRFRSNWARAGAGAFIAGDSTFTDCRFVSNNASAEGGGLSAMGGHTDIVSCAFVGNVTAQRGGGMVITEHGSAEIVNSTFQLNSAIGFGGAVAIGPAETAGIAGTIFCNNEPDAIDGPWVDNGGNTFTFVCPDSCYEHCGAQAPGGCWCDPMCLPFGDCCDDVCDHCNPNGCNPTDRASCFGWCGALPPGCWCDNVCLAFGDCCGDVCEACDYPACEGGRGSCVGLCGMFLHASDCGCGPDCLDEGNCCDDACSECGHCILGDLNGDGIVDVSDLLILLGEWGTCSDCNDCPADLNDDCVVDVSDLLILLGAWG